MSVTTAPFKIFSGTNSRYLAEKICKSLGCPLGNMKIEHFSDGEFSVSYEESIRGQYIYLVQSTFPNSDNLMELLLMIDAAKRASAYKIIAVIPYFGVGTPGQERQAARIHWSKADSRYAQCGRSRPYYYDGLTCRPDSGFFRCPRRSFVCFHHFCSLY